MPRIDVCQTLGKIDFPAPVWEWLDLLGNILMETQREAIYQEQTFLSDTSFKKLLVHTINKDLSTLNAIYLLLRWELIHQASSHVRLFCESLITLKYVSLDSESRSDLFWGYADMEAHGLSSSILERESSTAKPEHVESLTAFRESISEKYEATKGTYSFIDRKGRTRPFSNWCNKSVSSQADDCGPDFEKLYKLVYKQMSSYVHGTPWSLRRQLSYSRAHYQPDVVLIDIATIVRTASVVWVEWANLCMELMNWRLADQITEVVTALDEMEARHFPQKTP